MGIIWKKYILNSRVTIKNTKRYTEKSYRGDLTEYYNFISNPKEGRKDEQQLQQQKDRWDKQNKE